LPTPFNAASQQPSRRLLEKWNAAAIELRIDIDVIAACRSDLDACESDAAKRLIAIVDEATKREGRARIGVINRAVNLAIAAASDMAQYGVEDKWASPLMTFASGRGDCEDYALAKYAALRAAGFTSDDLRLVIVHLPQSRIDHAVLSVRDEGRWLILDNRRFAMLDAAHLDAVPLFALREDDAPAQVAAQFPDVPYLL
jgi:predicted transglutaminase-like cysteine proteinase